MQATHPVVIIDEPQLNKDFNTNEMIDFLKPNFVLSYSATPPQEIENDIIYKYTPEQAYNDRQVKRLEYYSITIGNSINATIELKKIKDKKAEILYNGKKRTLKVGDNFGEKVGDSSLRDYFVGNITNYEVFFTNQIKLSDLIAKSVNQEDLLRAEINETIKQHKNKNEKKLKKQNIKQLSLFFVPKVADFITNKEGEIGIVQTIFKEEYKKNFEPVISSITKERLRRAGAKIKQQQNLLNKVDVGFKCYKIVENPTQNQFEENLFGWNEKNNDFLLSYIALMYGYGLNFTATKIETFENREFYLLSSDMMEGSSAVCILEKEPIGDNDVLKLVQVLQKEYETKTLQFFARDSALSLETSWNLMQHFDKKKGCNLLIHSATAVSFFVK